MGIKLNLKNVKVVYVNVFEKSKDSTAANGDIVEGKFQYTVILDKKDPQIRLIDDAVFKMLSGPRGLKTEDAAEKWMSKNYSFGNHSDKCAFRDLAERDKRLGDFEEGIYFKASSHKPITVKTSLGETQIDSLKSRLRAGEKSFPRGLTIDGEDIEGQEVYGGCFANVSVDIYWHPTYKNLCASALGIRFRADGEAFGGAAEYASDDDLGDDDEATQRSRRHRDEDEKPTRSRRSRDDEDEDEEDDRPRRRRNRDED